jgi:hypothetical protein
MHDEDTIRRQAVDLSVLLPFRRFLLQRTGQGYAHNMRAHTSSVGEIVQFHSRNFPYTQIYTLTLP